MNFKANLNIHKQSKKLDKLEKLIVARTAEKNVFLVALSNFYLVRHKSISSIMQVFKTLSTPRSTGSRHHKK